MIWKTSDKLYWKERRTGTLQARKTRLERPWEELMLSTRKLIWLFSVNGSVPGNGPRRV